MEVVVFKMTDKKPIHIGMTGQTISQFNTRWGSDIEVKTWNAERDFDKSLELYNNSVVGCTPVKEKGGK